MKIIEFSPFFNENKIIEIKVGENKKWMDKLVVSEADYTYTYVKKEFNLEPDLESDPFIEYHKMQVKQSFKKSSYGISRKFPFIRYKNRGWYNEVVQRNYPLRIIESMDISDDDVLIFSDADEILDSRKSKYIIGLVKEHGIITPRLHFTMFYLNLFSKNWSGPDDYSYRVFIMTGKYYKENRPNIDRMRKLGEGCNKEFMDTIYCPDEFLGFHHSWLGDEKKILHKLKSFSHTKEDMDKDIIRNGAYDIELIKAKLASNQSIFPGHILVKDDSIRLCETIENSEVDVNGYFL